MKKINSICGLLTVLNLLILVCNAQAQRVGVLNQIDLPHPYYYHELYLPQLTSGPSSVAWSPDGKFLVFSLGGSLWKQSVSGETAEQLTDGPGYDYQPDWSPDGASIVFVRYNGTSSELMLLNCQNGLATPLTSNNAVNLEPRWSPSGRSIAYVSTANSGHFLIYKSDFESSTLKNTFCVTPGRKSSVKRYYYSAYDHFINPLWSRNSEEIIFVSNPEIAHGTGDIFSIRIGSSEAPTLIQHEETAWKTRPDLSPDGSRMVYSSYLGGNWHQLWLLPTKGGYPFPITYGDYDNTSPRWSPDGKTIAFISNRDGNTSLWLLNAFDGGQKKLTTNDFKFLKTRTILNIRIINEKGEDLPSRISITDPAGKFYSPTDAWIQADDAKNSKIQIFESHYFHAVGAFNVSVPKDKLLIEVSHGPSYEIVKMELDTSKALSTPVNIVLKPLKMPANFGSWRNGDLHVHMNYGGQYKNTPERLLLQTRAEDVNFVFNLIVNKEQRIPDLKYFSAFPDKVSNSETMILHGQEFHTSFWGHLGLLHLNDHLILPDYAGYPQTAAESLFPNNRFIADLAHGQKGLVGYVHPFEVTDILPTPISKSELPVDAALGKVDYYEVIGFADHRSSEAIWYRLLNCGLRIAAGAGTDAMANYASLRGPIGLNRVYVKSEGPLNENNFLSDLRAGKSFVTNGPLLGFNVNGVAPGDSIIIKQGNQSLTYEASLRSTVPVDHFEIVWNGEVIAKHVLTGSKNSLDVKGQVKVKGPGWLLLRVWSDVSHPDLMDLYPYASTNPVYVSEGGKNVRSKKEGEYFLQWLGRLEVAAQNFTGYRNEEEKKSVLKDIDDARGFYKNCVDHATIP